MLKKQSPALIKIVNILNDSEYHDGDSLGKALKMTRSAVWKLIKKLENYGVKIDSIKGKGYALLEPLILLEANKIKKELDEKVEIILLESTLSTNNAFKENKNNKNIKVCLAEQQTQGRGRFNRQWISPFGKNIYLSCFYPIQKDISALAGLSLVTALAVFKTLKSYGVDNALHVKWPNDILYQTKKISGTLIEIQAESHGSSHAIIGIGMNVNMLEKDATISQDWTSLRQVLGTYVDRNEVAARLINQLLAYLHLFVHESFDAFKKEWTEAESLLGKAITLKNMHQEVKGKVTGVNEQGHLLLQLSNGKLQAFSAGDTTITKK